MRKLLDRQVQWPYARAMRMWRSRSVTLLLALAAAWGLWTTINGVRLGPRAQVRVSTGRPAR
jgi:hypothetical protein